MSEYSARVTGGILKEQNVFNQFLNNPDEEISPASQNINHPALNYQIGGLTLQIYSDLPFNEETFAPKFKSFQIQEPAGDIIRLHHHFAIPEFDRKGWGPPVYRKRPWSIFKYRNTWIYLGEHHPSQPYPLFTVALFNHDYTQGHLFHHSSDWFRRGNFPSLTLLPTDQIILSPVLADREGGILHSSGINYKENGLLFIGHSRAGKTTISRLWQPHAEILCDDRIILRRHPGEGYFIHGTWSHGDLPDVSPKRLPLKGLFFLNQSKEVDYERITDKKDIVYRLLDHFIKAMSTPQWWEKMMDFASRVSSDVPCYDLYFDKSETVIHTLKEFFS